MRYKTNFGRQLRRLLIWLACTALLIMLVRWLWQQPLAQALHMGWRLAREPAPKTLAVPVEGVRARAIADTWGGARSGGRKHQGVDIFAARGTPIYSTTHGMVIAVNDYGIGGKHVWILGPASERHYYAHLQTWAPGLSRYGIVKPGTLIGTVGDTGNAKGTPPHLHYGIYRSGGAYNPWPLLQAGAEPKRRTP